MKSKSTRPFVILVVVVSWLCTRPLFSSYSSPVFTGHAQLEPPPCVVSPQLTACVSAGLRHFGKAEASQEELQAYLDEAYCGHLSVETSQLSTLEEREWFADRFEELKRESFSTEEKRQLAQIMLESQVGTRTKSEGQNPISHFILRCFFFCFLCISFCPCPLTTCRS